MVGSGPIDSDGTQILALVAVVGLLCLGVVAVLGVGPFDQPSGQADATRTTTTGTPTPAEEDASGDGSGGSGGGEASNAEEGTPSGVAFRFSVQRIEECGTRCRDVTAQVSNAGGTAAENVVVESRIYAGDDQIWSNEASLGRVESAESNVQTRRVEIGYLDAAKIQRNDGYIRIETTVTWDGGSTTFSERRKVA